MYILVTMWPGQSKEELDEYDSKIEAEIQKEELEAHGAPCYIEWTEESWA